MNKTTYTIQIEDSNGSESTPGAMGIETFKSSTKIIKSNDKNTVVITNEEEYHGSFSKNAPSDFLDSLSMRPCQKRRLKSEDWMCTDDNFSDGCDWDVSPSSFNDNGNELDFETSALSSFSSLEEGLFEAFESKSSKKSRTITEMYPMPKIPLPFIPNLNLVPLPPPPNNITPTDKDVLLGRGGMTNNHSGNKRYREEVQKLKPWYQSLETKQQKKELSQLMVDYVRDYGGRFLQKDEQTQQWVEASPKAARKKASQALREAKCHETKSTEEDYFESPG